MISNVNLEIEIVHDEGLGLTAQEIAGAVSVMLYSRLGLGDPLNGEPKFYTFGRRSMAGAEDKNNVSIFLRSAAVVGRA